MANEQEILVNFIGSNYGLIKKLDDQIIGSSSTLQRRSDDAKRILSDVVRGNITIPQEPNTPQFTASQSQHNIQILPNIVAPPIINQPSSSNEDGQMWLTFDDRDKIYDMLESIEEKLNSLLKRLEKLESFTNIPRKKGL